MLAPANHGSPLAAKGKSLIGRIVKVAAQSEYASESAFYLLVVWTGFGKLKSRSIAVLVSDSQNLSGFVSRSARILAC